MPIYAYRCDDCGFAKDVLQKVSDAVLTDCPSCSKPAFKKQLTAAGFQLKGTGWYVTDFRNGAGKTTPAAPVATAENAGSDKAPASASAGGTSDAAATPAAAATSSTDTSSAA